MCVAAAAEHTVIPIMMTTKRLDNFEVVCEWASCSFKGHTMEELSDHMSLHLKDYLGDNDALEELGEGQTERVGLCHVQGWETGLEINMTINMAI